MLQGQDDTHEEFRRASPNGVGALVIGGNYRGLGIVRSLGRRGIPVWVLRDKHALAATSRYARRNLLWPDADEASQVAYLLDLAVQYRLDGWTLFPTGDEDAALLARHETTLRDRYRITTCPWEVMRWGYDKRLTYSLAAQADVPVPWTYYPANREEVAALSCAYPIVLKPAVKKGFNPFVHDKAWLIKRPEELLARYDEACALVEPDVIMIQEYIPGDGDTQYSYAALYQDGQALAHMVARRKRQYPTNFGRSSTYVETIDLPEVETLGRRLLAAIRFTGLVEVEFKCDLRTSCYKLLDLNPRIWGWHTLGQRAGIDFPYLCWRLVHDESVPEIQARAGVRWMRMITDLAAAASEVKQGRLSVADYLGSLLVPLEHAIFAADDPIPALVEGPLLFHLAWKRGAV